MAKKKSVSQSEYGRAVGISRQAASKFLQQHPGTAPETKEQFILTYCEHLRDVAAGRISDGDLTQQRTRLAAAQAQKVERQNQVEAGELVKVQVVTEAWAAEFSRARSRLLAMPPKLAPLMMGVKSPAEAQGIIATVVWEALDELSKPDNYKE